MSTNQNDYTIFISAGEESGDAHGARLVSELKKTNPSIKFFGHGGDRMQAAGVQIVEHISKMSVVGLTEVIRHLPYFRKLMRNTVDKIVELQPKRIILIDYPGFNLRLAKNVAKLQVPATYFILPQAWAWNEKRVEKIKSCTDQALSIIPFEKKWFGERGLNVNFVGHPFVDMANPTISKEEFFSKHSLSFHEPLLTLLPGSRQREIDRHWPIYNEVVVELHSIFPNIQFIIGKAPNINFPKFPDYIKIEKDNVRLTMAHGTAGLIASGTATLEAAVFGLPTVVCYKTSQITYWLGKQLAKVKYISLVNLIANRQVVPEFIQQQMTSKALVKALIPLLSDTEERNKMVNSYQSLKTELGKPGVYERAAQLIIDKINV